MDSDDQKRLQSLIEKSSSHLGEEIEENEREEKVERKGNSSVEGSVNGLSRKYEGIKIAARDLKMYKKYYSGNLSEKSSEDSELWDAFREQDSNIDRLSARIYGIEQQVEQQQQQQQEKDQVSQPVEAINASTFPSLSPAGTSAGCFPIAAMTTSALAAQQFCSAASAILALQIDLIAPASPLIAMQTVYEDIPEANSSFCTAFGSNAAFNYSVPWNGTSMADNATTLAQQAAFGNMVQPCTSGTVYGNMAQAGTFGGPSGNWAETGIYDAAIGNAAQTRSCDSSAAFGNMAQTSSCDTGAAFGNMAQTSSCDSGAAFGNMAQTSSYDTGAAFGNIAQTGTFQSGRREIAISPRYLTPLYVSTEFGNDSAIDQRYSTRTVQLPSPDDIYPYSTECFNWSDGE